MDHGIGGKTGELRTVRDYYGLPGRGTMALGKNSGRRKGVDTPDRHYRNHLFKILSGALRKT